MASDVQHPSAPSLFTQPPPFQEQINAFPTITSSAEDQTLLECLPFLISPEMELNSHGVPKLRRRVHMMYLTMMLRRKFPPGFVAIDASRPWFLYWSLTGLHCLGEDLSGFAQEVVDTLRPCQSHDGGFGGGHGQMSHTATSYASVLSLVSVGRQDALDLIDRKAMWHWLGRMKQADGGFTVAEGGEEDIRGAYCSLTIIALLNLPLELPADSPARKAGLQTFTDKLGDWISRCQSFEGGIAGAPGNEAHGAYAFCGLACLSIIGRPSEVFPKYVDVDSLVSCLSSLQRAPYGGFAGRTNKLVDGCYSHWAGGCWALLDAALQSTPASAGATQDLWSREGLVRYVLSCAQHEKAGLRDKPGKSSDAYHSCYNLAGLSAAQYQHAYRAENGANGRDSDAEQFEKGNGLTTAFDWQSPVSIEGLPFDQNDQVAPVHPVFVIPFDKAQRCRQYFASRLGF